MLTKIIDLGCEVSETGEPRVRLMQNALVKTASTEIQEFWDAIEQDDNSAYLWVIGVSAREYYGCNNNGDAFDEADLKNTHQDFVNSAHVFLQHINKDPNKSIGKPVFSWYNDAMHRVELILKIDKTNPDSAATVAKIRNGEHIFVSMGCRVDVDICSICGNKAPTRKDYCDHLRYNMKKILPDGRQVYALNPNPKFFDISIVARPADPTAFTLDKRASIGNSAESVVMSSAKLGEMSNDLSLKTAALRKLSDIVKHVDGEVVDAKDSAIKTIKENGFENIEYPDMPYDRLEAMRVSPAGLVSSLAMLGAPLTLGDAAWMAGNYAFGHAPSRDEYHGMFGLLPRVLPHLIDHPEGMGTTIRRVFGMYNGEFDNPVHRTIVIRVIKPVAEARIRIIEGLSNPAELIKLGTAFGQPDEDNEQYGHTDLERIVNDFRPRKENFVPITLRDRFGHEAVTTPYHMRQEMFTLGPTGMKMFAKPTVAAALALGTIGAVLMQPTLLRKALAVASMGLPTAAVINYFKDDGEKVVTSEGDVIPLQSAAAMFKMEKKGSAKPPIRLGTMVGLAVPGAMALDYAYNQWKYGPYGNPEGDDDLTRAEKAVSEHPVAAGAVGGIAGSQLGRIGRALLRRGK